MDIPSLLFETMRFQERGYAWLGDSATLRALAFAVPFFAGASEMAGQSVTLVLNRVSRFRFIASLAFTGVVHIATAVIWALLTLLVASRFVSGPPPVLLVCAVIALSFGPRLFSILTIAPYYGEFLGRLLDGWMIACAAHGIHFALDLPGHVAAACSIAGWAIWSLLRNAGDTLLRPLIARIEVVVAGAPLTLSTQNVTETIKERFAQLLEGARNDD